MRIFLENVVDNHQNKKNEAIKEHYYYFIYTTNNYLDEEKYKLNQNN